MEDIEIPPFYVGQEVVANCDHPNGAFKRGAVFRVQLITKCKSAWVVSIGIQRVKGKYCSICGSTSLDWHFYAWRFSPKVEISGFISMKELADKKLEVIGAN